MPCHARVLAIRAFKLLWKAYQSVPPWYPFGMLCTVVPIRYALHPTPRCDMLHTNRARYGFALRCPSRYGTDHYRCVQALPWRSMVRVWHILRERLNVPYVCTTASCACAPCVCAHLHISYLTFIQYTSTRQGIYIFSFNGRIWNKIYPLSISHPLVRLPLDNLLGSYHNQSQPQYSRTPKSAKDSRRHQLPWCLPCKIYKDMIE